jgi:hypothetical protein
VLNQLSAIAMKEYEGNGGIALSFFITALVGVGLSDSSLVRFNTIKRALVTIW